jgi:hypothetical protein
MKHLFFTLVTIILVSFKGMSQNESISGSIYIKLIDIHIIINGLSDKMITQASDSISKKSNYRGINSDLSIESDNYFKFVLENKFFRKPFFKLKLESGKVINVFVDEREYLKLKKKLKGFNRGKERINLKFEGVKKSDGFFKERLEAIYYANKITLVEKVPGETDWEK